jgi:pimeloyl-ACP methyl ester carboxylesterase
MSHPLSRSFFVGGRYIADENGEHTRIGQMHVRRFGDSSAGCVPVVLFHGGGQTGAYYEQTPDGRPGFAERLAARGRAVYVVDLPGVGRSRYHEPTHGPLFHSSAERLERVFTATAAYGGWPQAAHHTQWPGTGRVGDPTFDAFYAGQVGYFTDFELTEPLWRAAGAALVAKIGACHLLTHSQSGPAGWHIADQCPGLVRGVVAMEPKGPPFFDVYADPTNAIPQRRYGITSTPLTYDPPLSDAARSLGFETESAAGPEELINSVHKPAPRRTLENLRRTPVLIVTGEASYHAIYDHRTANFLHEAGVPVEHANLAEHGIHGNGHLMALESNNDQIASFIARWLDRQDALSATPAERELKVDVRCSR